ncbi:hypothetical protein R3I94_009453 [Phoxinus phoxinus]
MLLFVIILSLTLQPGLSKPEPCANKVEKKRHDTFHDRHLNDGIPENVDIGKWQNFIKDWSRKIQSFFPKADHETVESVCSKGGKRYNDNLCISNEPIKFYTAHVNTTAKKVKEVEFITDQHVILACDKINTKNKCLPVHFEANVNKAKPEDKALPCS